MSGSWAARYMRLHEPGEEECDSRTAAIAFLAWGQEEGRLAPVAVVAPDGRVMLEGEDLDRALAEHLGV